MKTYYLIYKFGLMRYLLSYFGVGETVMAISFGIGAIVCIVAGYLLGGLNFAIILSRKEFGVDVRDFGSGNAGSTNMRRTFGAKAGYITLLGDVSKTIVACLIGYLLLGLLGAYIAGLFSMLGHMFPIKYKFKGGKGVACTAALILMTTAGDPSLYFIPVVFFIVLGCFILIVLGTKFISLGSIMSALIYPLVLNAFHQINIKTLASSLDTLDDTAKLEILSLHAEDGLYIIISIIVTALVVFMHRENIKRLLEGKESKFELHASGKKNIYEKTLENNVNIYESKNTDDESNPSKKNKNKK